MKTASHAPTWWKKTPFPDQFAQSHILGFVTTAIGANNTQVQGLFKFNSAHSQEVSLKRPARPPYYTKDRFGISQK
jgi:hypothetical protein